MNFFLSYKRSGSDDTLLAKQIKDALEADGHDVFIDTGIRIGRIGSLDRAADRMVRCHCRPFIRSGPRQRDGPGRNPASPQPKQTHTSVSRIGISVPSITNLTAFWLEFNMLPGITKRIRPKSFLRF